MFEFLSSQRRVVELNGGPVNLNEVEAALLEDPLVEACAVLIRKGDRTELELVPYLVATESLCPQRLQACLQNLLPADLLPTTYVPVSSLPLTSEGNVDEAALARLEVIDADLVQRWEEQLQRLPEVEQVAVRVHNQTNSRSSLHVSDLLPNWKAISGGAVEVSVTCLNQPSSQAQGPGQLAISHGEPLRDPDKLPKTLPDALKRAALSSPEKGVVYIQPDDSEVVQSYPELLEQAQRILAGLRKLGLQPEDKVIIQLPHNQDFISTFWGCLLGGFVPVPMEVAPTYQAANSTVKKLHQVWRLLEKPLIVTGRELESAIAASFNPGDLTSIQLTTVETLKAGEPDRHWHDSDPDDLALLLLTSGSTGKPKGVMLSHRLILYRAAISAQRHQMNRESVSINWLPLDHVSGIAQFHVRDIYLGCQQIHAPTDVFLQDPLKWLDWIDRFRVNLSWAPNFAYGLVNDHANRILSRHWDLSSMQIFLNAGEAIAPQTARRFMELMTPHGLPATAMHPAWGMSETAGAVVYSDRYSLATEDDQFVETGSPGPDLSIRIVDSHNQVVSEGVIGALQIKGPMVTSGYYQNPEANQAAFTDDGWFNTGDLGFIQASRVTITGRQKDVIIINGLNYYCHEIEAIVEDIAGVAVSYTAACGFRTANSDTDQLAIFFHPLDANAKANETELLELLNQIRGNVVKNVGVNPTYLIPVDQSAIPKTGIGKIQRSQLKQRLESGEFDAILKRIDILSRNANTLPDWFYQQIWRCQAIERWHASQHWSGTCLIFLDSSGLGAFLSAELDKVNQPCIRVEMGSSFAEISPSQYQIDPQNPDHYQQLWFCLQTDEVQIDRIIHLWTYGDYQGEISSLDALEQAQAQGVYSLLCMVQALEQIQTTENPVRLLIVSSYAQAIAPEDAILHGRGYANAYEKSPLLGLLKTIPQEIPGLHCSHIDLSFNSVEVNASYVLQELWAVSVESEVAYRQGKRLVPRLEAVQLSQESPQDLPFKQGGMYLITGGLGDIGVAIATYLLQHHQAKLLLVGRTPLPEQEIWSSHLAQSSRLSEKIKAYLNLEQLGGEVRYAAVDMGDFPQLQQVVNQAAANWRCELDGVIHLAGLYQEQLLVNETPESFAQVLHPQVMGTWRLPQLLPETSKGLFISFASVNGRLGGFKVGAFAAASRFLSSFSTYQRQRGLQSYCIAWSMWDDMGISRGYPMRQLARDRGYDSIHRQQGLYSFLAALHHDCAQLLVGLDGNNPRIRKYVETPSSQTQILCAYLAPSEPQIPISTLHKLAVKDRFGQPTTCEFHQVQEIPIEEANNREQLPGVQSERVMPQTDLERQVADIWQEVLGIPVIGLHDNFFELGGHSLLATQVIYRLRQAFKVELPLHGLFDAPTVISLAESLIEHEPHPGLVLKIAQLREQLNTMSPDEIRAKLQAKKKVKELQ